MDILILLLSFLLVFSTFNSSSNAFQYSETRNWAILSKSPNCCMTMVESENTTSRRTVLSSIFQTSLGIGSAGLIMTIFPDKEFVVSAKEDDSVDTSLADEFNALEKEFNDVRDLLANKISHEDWAGLMTQTQALDQEFRKQKMGTIRKRIPKTQKRIRDTAQLLCNAVTFDLIAINKASRIKSSEEAKKALDILQQDVKTYLELEQQLK